MIDIIEMRPEHIDEIIDMEKDAPYVPWSKESFIADLNKNYSFYFCAVVNDVICGYAGMWHVINEGHITNIFVKAEYRNMKIGSALLQKLIDTAIEKEMIGITLEVKISNLTAQRLYTKYGFKPEGIRKNYYADTNEDAVLMWKNMN